MVDKPVQEDITKDAEELFPLTAESVNNLNRERRIAYIIGRQKECKDMFSLEDMLEAIKYGFEYHRDSMNDGIDVPNGNSCSGC